MNAPQTPEVLLEHFVIYAHPRDYPNGFVVRRWVVMRGQREPVPDPRAIGFDKLEAARQWLEQRRPDLVCVQRDRFDNPCIVEVWL